MDKNIYLNAFQKTIESNPDTHRLYGDLLIVEKLDLEKYVPKKQIIIANAENYRNTKSASLPVFARILMCGEGFYDSDKGEEVPLVQRPGDIILVGQNSISHFSQFGKFENYGKIEMGIVSAGEILMIWHGEAGFNTFFDGLNESIEESEDD